MKRTIYLGLIISLIIGSCAQEKKSSIEGAWKLVYAKWTAFDQTFPAQVQGSSIKFWSKENYAFDGQFKIDSMVIMDNYGWGTYKLDGNKYTEQVILHADKPSIGKAVRLILEIKNDTLIQSYPADENWKLPEKYSTEKFIRLK
jgi:hypothetical protein